MKRPTYGLSTRPLGPDQAEIRAACKHGAHRVGWQLGPTITIQVAACSTIGVHSMLEGCTCLAGVWAKYRTDSAPADLAAMVERFAAFWARVEDDRRRQGYALIDWQAACVELMGVVV